jgi:hypothetical protein
MLPKLLFALAALSIPLVTLTACTVVTAGRNDESVKPPSFLSVQEIGYESMLTVVAKSALPVFIEEYDPKHCDSACTAQHQLVNNLAEAYKGKVNFFRVTTSEEEFQSGLSYPVYYMVMPPLQVYDTASGAKSEAELKTFIDEAYAEMYPPPEEKDPTTAAKPGSSVKPGSSLKPDSALKP